jgi:hypothetical protein
MQRIVNNSTEELVVENFGEKNLELIKKRSGIEVDYFIGNELHDDAVICSLAGAISEEMHVILDPILFLLGKSWIHKHPMRNMAH